MAKEKEGAQEVRETESLFTIGDSPVAPATITKPTGSLDESIKERDKRDKEIKERERQENERKRIKLNDAADVVLSCLEPSSAQDIRMAAKDYKIRDMGVYILGLINRLVKTVDYYEPDIEAEWESGKVGYSSKLTCKYCGKDIEEPKNIKQIYCSNRCARRDRDFGETGIVFPNQHGTGVSDVEVDEKKWEQEQKRIGVI
jgi:hypothetical protein